jgi:hypothetical protein
MATKGQEDRYSESEILKALGEKTGPRALTKLKALRSSKKPLTPDQYQAVIELVEGRAGKTGARALAGLAAYFNERSSARKALVEWAKKGKASATRPTGS